MGSRLPGGSQSSERCRRTSRRPVALPRRVRRPNRPRAPPVCRKTSQNRGRGAVGALIGRKLFRVSGDAAGFFDVTVDLRFEFVYAGEASLVPYSLREADVHDAAVEIALEVKEVSLDPALRPVERGGDSHVGTGRVMFLADANEARVHAAGRHERGRVRAHVGGREADGAAPPVSLNHFAPDNVGSPQESGGLYHLTLG